MSAGKPGATKATVMLLAILLLAACLGGVSSDLGQLRSLGARPALWGFSPRPEQLFLPLFLHYGWAHWLSNCLSLFLVGASLEGLVGGLGIVYIFGLSGVASILASLIFRPQLLAVGCSGAVFGLWGARLLHSWWPPGEAIRYRLSVIFAFSLGLAWLPQLMGIPIDQAAHAGGLLAGFLSYSAYRAGPIPRGLWLALVLIWAGYTARGPWLPSSFGG